MYKPYPRQQEAIDKMVAFVEKRTSKKGIFVYPTGFGKSIVIANTANKFPDKHFINIAPRQELIEQNYEKFTSYGYEASLCSASLKSNEVGKITFGTIGTLKKHIDFFKDKNVVLLSDECDEASKKGSELHLFLKKIKKHKLLGTTATPLRLSKGEIKMMNRDDDCFFSSIEDVVQVSEVIENGYWSKLSYGRGIVNTSALELNSTGNDYTKKSLKSFSVENDILKRCIKGVEHLQKLGKKSILIFVSSIDDANRLSEMLPGCESVHSKTEKSERTRIITGFKNMEIPVVVQVNLLSIGFDHPRLDGIVMARPTNSFRLYYQAIGRGVRTHADKEGCYIVDISGNYDKFGRIETITYEDSPLTDGWACFSGNKLVTGYPLISNFPPTKKTLLREANLTDEERRFMWNFKMPFGKYKGATVRELDRTRKGKGYLAWMGNEMKSGKFMTNTHTKKLLSKAVYMYLKID